MNTQEREGWVWNRVNVGPDKFGLLRAEQQILAPERDNLWLGRTAGHDRYAVRLEASAGQDVTAFNQLSWFAADHHHWTLFAASGVLPELGDLKTQVHMASGLLKLFSIDPGHLAPIDDAGVGGPEGLKAAAVGLVLSDAFLALNQFDVRNLVLLGPLEQSSQPLHLQLVGGHHDLSALLVRDTVLVAVLVGGLQPCETFRTRPAK